MLVAVMVDQLDELVEQLIGGVVGGSLAMFVLKNVVIIVGNGCDLVRNHLCTGRFALHQAEQQTEHVEEQLLLSGREGCLSVFHRTVEDWRQMVLMHHMEEIGRKTYPHDLYVVGHVDELDNCTRRNEHCSTGCDGVLLQVDDVRDFPLFQDTHAVIFHHERGMCLNEIFQSAEASGGGQLMVEIDILHW